MTARTRAWTLAAATFASLSLLSIAAAKTAGGPALPDGVKRVLWSQACDMATVDYRVKCADDPAACPFVNSSGRAVAFARDVSGPTFYYARGAMWGPFAAVLKAAGHERPVVDQKRAGTPFAYENLVLETLLGLPKAVQAKDRKTPLKLSSALVRWAERELIPPPDFAMCGATAQEVYDAGFREAVRRSADAYTHLTKKGLTKGVSVRALDRANQSGKGKLFTTCQAYATQAGVDDPMAQYAAVEECRFWLRRASVGQARPVAGFLATLMATYDPEGYAERARALPKR